MSRYVYRYQDQNGDAWTATVVTHIPLGWLVAKYIANGDTLSHDMMMVADEHHDTLPEDFRGPGESLSEL